MTKKLLAFVCLLLAHFANAQYNNEWIDYSNTYFKIKVGQTGLYRIPQSTLANAGLANVNAQDFQLWKNGQQVPLYTTTPSGVMGTGSYIEFFGERNDGSGDAALFKNPNDHIAKKRSLFTDTAIYFLTVKAGNNLRFQNQLNEANTSTLSPQPFVFKTLLHDYKGFFNGKMTNYVNRGVFNLDFRDAIYKSEFTSGEMPSSNDIYATTSGYGNAAAVFSNLLINSTAGVPARVRIAIAGASLYNRNYRLFINDQLAIDKSLNGFESRIDEAEIPVSMLNNTTTLGISNTDVANRFDRIVASYVELTYPAVPDAAGSGSFLFSLPARANPVLIKIARLQGAANGAVLYNLQQSSRSEGQLQPDGAVAFLIPASANEQNFVLVANDASQYHQVLNTESRTFTNFSSPTNQGDFLIITNSSLLANNYVEDYRQYRSTAAGGGHQAKTVTMDQLQDQFAYGVHMHPLAIKNFLRFARANFTQFPRYCFLIGKGVTFDEYRPLEDNSKSSKLQLVPTFGHPGSDILLATDDFTSANLQTFIGRLSVISASEVNDYLTKVKQYEAAQNSQTSSQENSLWRKNVVHVVGANDPATESVLTPMMANYERIIEDTLFGGNVTTFNKSNSSTASIIENKLLETKFKEGISLFTYFGHSSATALDYNLDDPSRYNNPGKYPVFLLNGCNAGNFFTFDSARLQLLNTISERYVLAKERGSIGMIASTHFGIISGLNDYSTGFYNSVSKIAYGETLGKHMQNAINFQNQRSGINSLIPILHTQQQTLHGDPSLRIYYADRPDYAIETSDILINPSFVSIAQSSFKTKIFYYNLGRAIQDSIFIQVARKYPASNQYPTGFTEIIYRKKVQAPFFVDSLEIETNIIATRDKGANQITVSLDTESTIAELSEQNNVASKELFIFEDEIRPIYPYDYAIVHRPVKKLIGSTSQFFTENTNFRLEFDTTSLFNSSVLSIRNQISKGGIVEFDVSDYNFKNNTVYYWRLGIVKTGNNQPDRWNNSSFILFTDTDTSVAGYNQSHFYQHTNSLSERIYLDSSSREWKFAPRTVNLFVNHSVFGFSGATDSDFSFSINNVQTGASACVGHSIIFNLFDSLSFKPMRNYPGGLFGSGMNNCAGPNDLRRQYNFEFSDLSSTSRKSIMDFMDQIPNGTYVLVRKVLDQPFENESYANVLQSDEAIFGAGNSVYQRLKTAGFAEIDSFKRPRIFVMLYKKNDQRFTPVIKMSEGIFDRIQLNENIRVLDSVGTITSPVFGPAKKWQNVLWNLQSKESPSTDHALIDVIGISQAGNETKLYTLQNNQSNFNLASINAASYPYLKLRMRNADSINITPWQLNWWRLYYTPVPEGALAPNLLLSMKDSFTAGEPLIFKIAFKNISEYAFDSLLVKAVITDKNNIAKTYTLPRFKPLISGDSITITVNQDTKLLAGINTLYLSVNPDFDQPEQYLFNNIIYKTFWVAEDKEDPLLDVTFDGQRILNHDIVSARPHIQIKLEDDNPILLLNNPQDIIIKLKYPGENEYRTYNWGSDTLQFIPAGSGTNGNVALANFFPVLSADSKDGDYELVITGKDRAGNMAGNMEYRVTFQVFNKPMISNLLNYPNPFSTSTAFVFTLTGHQVPQEFKIQIFTVTGRIVREITRQELGNIHIGTNITDFKWDGTDMFGQQLANGVYLYRLVTSLDGAAIDKFRLNDGFDQNLQDATDKFFNKGYGKMVILR